MSLGVAGGDNLNGGVDGSFTKGINTMTASYNVISSLFPNVEPAVPTLGEDFGYLEN